jgi:hypothetical protein
MRTISTLAIIAMISISSIVTYALYQNHLLVIYPPTKETKGQMILIETERKIWPYKSNKFAVRYDELDTSAHEWIVLFETHKSMIPYSKYVDQFVSEGFSGVYKEVKQVVSSWGYTYQQEDTIIPKYKGKIEKPPVQRKKEKDVSC